MNYNFELICSNCNNDNIVEDRAEGNYLCRRCGLVVDTIISAKPERFEDYTDLSYGAPGAVSNLYISNNSDFRPFYEAEEDYDPSLILAEKTIKSICSILNIPKSVMETAYEQLDKVRDKMGSFKGHNVEDIAITVLYIAVGICNKPYTLTKICQAFGVDKARIEGLYFKISQYTDKPEAPEKKYFELCNIVCKKLGLSKEEIQKAEKVLAAIVNSQLLAGKPTTSVGVAIYGAVKDDNEKNSELAEKLGKELGRTSYVIKENYMKIQNKLQKVC